MDSDPGQLLADELAFACVEAASRGQAEPIERVDDGKRAADRTSRSVEAGEKAVAPGVYLAPAIA